MESAQFDLAVNCALAFEMRASYFCVNDSSRGLHRRGRRRRDAVLAGRADPDCGRCFISTRGTLVINVTGSLILAFLYAFLESVAAPAQWRALLGIGFCGGYTTFSTFSYEAVQLLQDGQWQRAGVYVLSSFAGEPGLGCAAGTEPGCRCAGIPAGGTRAPKRMIQ